MIKSFHCINISSQSPRNLVTFYRDILGVPVLSNDNENCDGAMLGFIPNAPQICVWDETKWGKSNFGAVTFVFQCDDLEQTYNELKQKGVELDPPSVAVWGGKELLAKDPDGNILLMLEE